MTPKLPHYQLERDHDAVLTEEFEKRDAEIAYLKEQLREAVRLLNLVMHNPASIEMILGMTIDAFLTQNADIVTELNKNQGAT